MTRKPLYIEEVMRFIYIFGILLLIAIGFLVYYYWDWIMGLKEGFAGAGTTGVFQLYEQRCIKQTDTVSGYYGDKPSKFPVSVTKSTANDICRSLGARLATYSEIRSAVNDGFTIPTYMPVFANDSDVTYVSSGRSIIPDAMKNKKQDSTFYAALC